MSSEIWLPDSAKNKPRFTCRICNHKFESDAVYEQHVVACSRDYEQELYEFSQRKAVYHAEPDAEWGRYNRDLIAQGIDPDVQFNRGRKTNIRRASES